jgi:hypothetical protein
LSNVMMYLMAGVRLLKEYLFATYGKKSVSKNRSLEVSVTNGDKCNLVYPI